MGVKKFYRPILGYDGQMIEGGSDAAVQSVNGQTGAVTLTAADVGALPDTYAPPVAPVQSVNGQTGAVTLTAADVGALPDTYTPPAAPVQSVNGQTGAVTLTASDVGAATAAQGATADTALQPADLSFAAISAIEGDWRGEGVETLGAALLALQAEIVP